jgi:hypothetical protein
MWFGFVNLRKCSLTGSKGGSGTTDVMETPVRAQFGGHALTLVQKQFITTLNFHLKVEIDFNLSMTRRK